MLSSHPQAWLIVALIIIVGASVRHFLNRHDAGDPLDKIAWTLPVAAVALGAAIWMTAPRVDPAIAGLTVTEPEVLNIIGKHCAMCHSAHPSHAGLTAPPKDVILNSPDDVRRHAAQVLAQAVSGDAMPLGNETGMTRAERQKLGAFLLNR
jgi:uncharacterized membrane protein